MNFLDLISPLFRNKALYLLLAMLLTAGTYTLVDSVLPDTQKTTLYFSVKPASAASGNDAAFTLDPLESSMKVAEMISGWAKDPSFRKMILVKSGATIDKFKKKITAKKQNRANVFWTLKLPKREENQQSILVEGVKESIRSRLETFNQDNQYPFAITPIEESIDYSVIPFSWRLTACLILSLLLGYLLLFVKEMVQGRVSFMYQVQQIFPGVPLFYFTENQYSRSVWAHFLGKQLVKQTIYTFNTNTYKALDLVKDLKIDPKGDTSVICVKLGKTSFHHLENLAAAYAGEKVALVVFG